MNFQPDNMKSTWMSWVPSWTINLLEMTKLEWGKSNLIQPNMDGTIIKISNQVAQNTRFISWPFHTSELNSTRKLTDRPNRLHNDQSSMAMCGLLDKTTRKALTIERYRKKRMVLCCLYIYKQIECGQTFTRRVCGCV